MQFRILKFTSHFENEIDCSKAEIIIPEIQNRKIFYLI